MELTDLNHWWEEKKVKVALAPQTHRAVFYDIKKDINRKQVQLITGLRRVGKSTVLFQTISSLIQEGVSPTNILYCSFDEPELAEKKIEEILKDYSKITEVSYKKERVYLFLDEVQKAKGWVPSIKLLYDNLPNIKTIVSGSASLNILSEAKTSLAGRAIYYELRPLSFKEFLTLTRVKAALNSPLVYKEMLEREFEKFITRPFPEIISEKDHNFIKNYVRNSVIEPVILKDIPKEFEGVDIILLQKLISILLENPGQYLIIDNLAKDLGRAKVTLYKALFYFEFSYLTRTIHNFRPAQRASSRKLSRIYAYHPCLTLPFNAPIEKYMENLAAFELDAKNYWRDKEKEIDFLKGNTPVEVKIKPRIDRQDTRWIEYFIKKYGKSHNIKKAYILTKEQEGKIGKIKLIPFWKFCISGLK